MEETVDNMDNIFEVMSEVSFFCESDDLSMPALKKHISQLISKLPRHIIKDYYKFRPFFHNVCMNERVTMEMIQYLLLLFPYVCETKDENSADETYAYPLHFCCYNQYCSSEIIKFILEKHPKALGTWSAIERRFDLMDYGGEDEAQGLPIHYYLTRESNVDINTFIMLVNACPGSISAADNAQPFTPLHVILSNPNINNMMHILVYLLGIVPTSINMLDGVGRTPLNIACFNENMTLEVVKFIFNLWPGALSQRHFHRGGGFLPIHFLCFCSDGTASLDILRFMLSINPNLPRERDGQNDSQLPIHHAVGSKSTAFCKGLIYVYPESLRVGSGNNNSLPIHFACRSNNVDTVQYMLKLDPDLINARDRHGQLPIHYAARGDNVRIIELLLKYDPDAASKETTGEDRSLPIHVACYHGSYLGRIEAVQVLYDACPHAILVRDRNGKTPLELAKKEAERWRSASAIANFLETQHGYLRQTKDLTAMYTPDENGWLPLHHALKDKAPLGSIKLLVESSPSAMNVPDKIMASPLHIACEFSSAKVVKYLVELDSCSTMNRLDTNKDSTLYYACRAANLEVIKYLLDEHASLVSSAEANEAGELPIHSLCEAGKDKVDSESSEYIEVIWRMLLANPETVVGA